ncbi:MAG: DUF2333 family protein [Proteobacteria bacterium]|nr:DUF2333 family protein [Pseudomonadota bacterium]
MATHEKSGQDKSDAAGFGGFAFSRIILVIIIACAFLWLARIGISYIREKNITKQIEEKYHQPYASIDEKMPVNQTYPSSEFDDSESVGMPDEDGGHVSSTGSGAQISHSNTGTPMKIDPPMPPGVAFVDETIKPLDYELHKRFWGWRPNDIFRVTDNVNCFQKGVLEVTRKTALILFERISRTGSTVSFDKNLENAQNWFMVQPTRLWFPFFQSPERSYADGLEELKKYRNKLLMGEATFFNRADNLIPLLESYRNLLGSCDDDLVKTKEPTGETVSSFSADDYLYYAQGVATAMKTILGAVEKDFHSVLVTRHGLESLEHAIASCDKAAQINPWVVTEASLSGVLANHRANMATAISHARFYIGVLIKTMST